MIMSSQEKPFKHVAVVSHPNVPAANKQATQIASFFEKEGIDSFYSMLYDPEFLARIGSGEVDLVIALGGDGTMLRAGHLCASRGIPLLGINLGHFGFLIEIRKDQWQEALIRLLKGDYWLESRMMLCVEHHRSEERLGTWDALNEVVVGRGKIVRPVHLNASVDGRFLTTYVADGLIAATPTGSTAYALAVGGPILPPELRNILLVPVAPHLSIDRAIVLSEGSAVSIVVNTSHQAVMSIDGQPPIDLQDGDCVQARAGDYSAKFVRFQDPGYFYRNLTPHMNQNPSTGNNR
jgi:NAD+ kinase